MYKTSLFQAFHCLLGAFCVVLLIIPAPINAERLARSESRIVDGVNVTPVNKYPMIVSFLENEEPVCSGTILNKYYILTTAGCAGAVNENPSIFYVLAGTYNVGSPDPRYVQNVSCKSATVHVRFRDPSKGFFANNIGVIRLSRPLIWNDHVAPTNLPKPSWSVLPYDQKKVIAVGWGLGRNRTYPYPPTRPLQEVEVPLLNSQDCQRVYGNRQITDNILCTFQKEGAGACDRDAGSPLFIYDEVQDKHVQIALTAWTDVYCGNSTSGYDPLPVGYTKVSKYDHWIEEVIRECNAPRAI